MKKVLILIVIIASLLGVSGCGRGTAAENTSVPTTNMTNATNTPDTTEKNWSEEDIVNMFSQVQETTWEYIDCVLISDYASDRVGALLFWDNQKKTSSVAFFRADGHSQQCGIYAKTSADPDFRYLGDGAVTFQAESEDGISYHCTITISIDGENVNFKVDTDFNQQ